MPHSKAAIEKSEWFEKALLPGLQRCLRFKRNQTTTIAWDAGLDGWSIHDKRIGKDVVTIIGFGDKITTKLGKNPVWLVNLAKKISEKYPYDSVYINGKIFSP